MYVVMGNMLYDKTFETILMKIDLLKFGFVYFNFCMSVFYHIPNNLMFTVFVFLHKVVYEYIAAV